MARKFGTGGFFRRYLGLFITGFVSLLLIAALLVIQNRLSFALDSQLAAQRWGANSENGAAQVSIFYANGTGLSQNDVYSLRSSIDSALIENSITAPNADARLWYDAYSAETTVTVSTERANVEAAVTAVGGDFFRIHPLPLKSGYYFSDSDLNADRIVIDTVAAWQLFGSVDAADMMVTINNRPYLIAGVVAPEDDRWNGAVYGDMPRIYMDCAAFGDDSELNMTCYEAVLPDPVTGFGANLLSEKAGTDNARCLVVENSARFSFASLWKLVSHFAESRVVKVPVIYPYWESAARILEAQSAFIQAAWCILCLIPAAELVLLGVWLWKHRRFHFSDIPELYENITERLRARPRKSLKLPKLRRRKSSDDSDARSDTINV